MIAVPEQTCEDSHYFSTTTMTFGCDLQRVFNYNGSQKDMWINYATLLLTTIALILCTRKAGESASRYARAAAWFWLPFTMVLFGMQIFADCSTDNVGISAVWSAFAGFIFLAWWRIRHIWGSAGYVNGKHTLSSFAIFASLVVWTVVCVYYAVVEEAITTVAHLVAFGVGTGALLLFEVLHQIPRDAGFVGVSSIQGGGGGGVRGSCQEQPSPYEELKG